MLLKDFAKIFFTILVIHLAVVDVGQNQMMIYFTKPLILFSLIAFFAHHTENRLGFEKVFLGGLFFSLVGDVFLMLTTRGENFFLMGLGAFFIAQLLYTIAYFKELNGNTGLLKKQPYLAIPLLLLGAGIVYILRDGLGGLAIPIIAYATIITIMALAALNRHTVVSTKSFWLVFAGALFFITSDACIALDKFVDPIPKARLIIMSTYGIAQFLMVWGVLETRLRS